jgi:hypothetical protein
MDDAGAAQDLSSGFMGFHDDFMVISWDFCW